ncbi:hypothetical protein V8F20_007950 [Naviculisporaceae sp. PSN 640]
MYSFGLLVPVLGLGVRSALAQREYITKRQDVLKPTVSVTEYTEWSYLRECERRILSEDDWLGGDLKGFGCTYPFDNICYCNTAKAEIATSYISSVVFSYCGDYASDYSAAVNVYDQYCSDVSAGTHPEFHATPLTDTVTIHNLPAFGSLGNCGRRILSEDDWLRGTLKCPSPWYNNCYCNQNLGSIATSYISSCIFTYCSTISAEFDAAVSVYNEYCDPVRATMATATPGAGSPETPVTATSTNGLIGGTNNGGNPSRTDTPNSPTSENNNNSNNGLSTASLIGIIVSVVCSVLGLVFGIGFKIWQHRREQAKKRQEADEIR